MQLSGKAAAMGQGVIQDVSVPPSSTPSPRTSPRCCRPSVRRKGSRGGGARPSGAAAPRGRSLPRRGDRRERGQGKGCGTRARSRFWRCSRSCSGWWCAGREGRARHRRSAGSSGAAGSRSPPSSTPRKSAPQPVGADGRERGRRGGRRGVRRLCRGRGDRGRGERAGRGEQPSLLHFGIADEDAWSVGLPCGGEISVWVERYATDRAQARFAEADRDGGRGALVTVLGGPAPPARSSWWRPAGTAPAHERARPRRGGALAEAALWSKAAAATSTARWSCSWTWSRLHPACSSSRRRPRLRRQLAALARAGGWRPAGDRSAQPLRDMRALPGCRGRDRRLAARGARAARGNRPRHLHRRPHPRPQARRRHPRDRAALGRRLRGRDGQPPGAGQAARAAAGRRAHRRGAVARGGPDRPGHRRAHRRGDRRVDHGRDDRRAARALRRAPSVPRRDASTTRRRTVRA